MTTKRNLIVGSTFIAVLAALGTAQVALQRTADAAGTAAATAPKFEVDPMWPKPLPNGWYLGQTIGVGVDANDHVWIIHRSDSLDAVEAAADEGTGACCKKAPPIMEFDQQGTLLRHFGGKDGEGYQWPASNHGLQIDGKGNIWIGGNGNGNDGHLLKFTQDGKFLMQVGIKKQGLGPDSNSHQGVARQQEQRGLRRRRLRQQARRRHRYGYRQVQALLGRVREQAG